MIGFFIGDTVGSPLLYMIKKDINYEIVNAALKMEGGGIVKMNPSERSQESEVNLCILDQMLSNIDNGLDISDLLEKVNAWL